MISAFGVEHVTGISKMSNTELRHRKRVQAGLSTAGAVVGLSALGAKGVKVGTGKYLKPAAKAVKINTKIDSGVNNALVVGGGIGGAAGLNSAAISRAESKKPHHIHKANGNRRIATGAGLVTVGGASRFAGGKKAGVLYHAMGPGSKAWTHADAADKAHQPWEIGAKIHHTDQHNAFLRDAAKTIPKIKAARKLGGAAVLGGAVIAASGARKKLSKLDTSARGSNQHKRQVKIAVPRVTPKQRRHAALATSTGMLAGAGIAAGGNKKKLAVGLIAGGSALSGYAASDPNDYIREKKVSKSAFGVDHAISKAFDPEARRHTQLGVAAGVSGSIAAASGASSLRSAHKARGHFRTASGANQTTKSRLLEGLNLKGAAQINHAKKTAVGHGEMLQHIRAGNTAAHRARGKAGVALGSAAAAGAIIHHSNNGAANYVGPYQPKAKYAQGAKKTVTQLKRRFS